jgi:restriction endonuclease Mrr
MFENTLVQVQAKRWLHSVGRKEVAELRGSLQPFAKGAVVTTSHFSRAAINEATDDGRAQSLSSMALGSRKLCSMNNST